MGWRKWFGITIVEGSELNHLRPIREQVPLNAAQVAAAINEDHKVVRGEIVSSRVERDNDGQR
jgi:hypothetical protein